MAVADEYWDTELGRIIYEADVEGQAILSFPTDSDLVDGVFPRTGREL